MRHNEKKSPKRVLVLAVAFCIFCIAFRSIYSYTLHNGLKKFKNSHNESGASNVQVHTYLTLWLLDDLHFFLGDLMIFKHCEWALLSLSLQTHEWHEEFKFWPHFFQLCRVVNCDGKSQRSSNEDELFHRKYDKASNNFSRGKWRNTVGVVSGLVREENKKKSSHGLFYNFTKYSNIWQLYLHRIGLEFSLQVLQVFKWLFVNKRSSHCLQVTMLKK